MGNTEECQKSKTVETSFSMMCPDTLQIICCPACRSELQLADKQLICQNKSCDSKYPLKNGRPVLLNERNSLFQVSDYEHISNTDTEKPTNSKISKIKNIANDLAPTFSSNLSSDRCFDKFIEIVLQKNDSPTILVVGCGKSGKGIQKILSHPSMTVINTDVSPNSYANMFCDGHDIPFKEGVIDGVIVQAVLEHTIDPNRVVEEIHRVLKHDGIVYSEIPFIQQGHSGRYDFTRFTHLGHRRLFRNFEEVESGVVAGAGTSLAWSYEYFLMAFGRTRPVVKLMSAVARATGFWLKYFDYILRDNPGSIDAASCTYFFGKKSKNDIPDKEIIEQYRGAQ